MEQITNDDRRSAPRIDVSLHLHLIYSDLDELVEYYSHNISEGGIFVKTEAPLPIGSKVRLQISLVHQSLLYIDARGEVVHTVEKDTPGSERGMGIRFIEMCEESQQFLKDFVLTRIKEEDKPEAPEKVVKKAAPKKKGAPKKKTAARKKPAKKTAKKRAGKKKK